MKEINIKGVRCTSRILIGASIKDVGELTGGQRMVIITDENLDHHYRDLFPEGHTIVLPPGEGSKSLETIDMVYGRMLEYGADRSTFLLGIGGGVVCDVAGYVASTYLRGLDFGYVSTSLLSMVDASVGGKNGVNFHGFKNMIGTINQPSFVLCDLSLLNTLPEDERINGFAEIVKHGLIGSLDHFNDLVENHQSLLKLESSILERILYDSISIKSGIVEKDEHEKNLRRLLNFGHTMGHAIEYGYGYSHGSSISQGMLFTLWLSNRLGLLSQDEMHTVRLAFQKLGLSNQSELEAEKIIEAMRRDKKKAFEELHFILLEKIGHPLIRKFRLDELSEFVMEYFRSQKTK